MSRERKRQSLGNEAFKLEQARIKRDYRARKKAEALESARREEEKKRQEEEKKRQEEKKEEKKEEKE